ncbi:MAG: FAD-binding oxidoreductase, partial [Deltaproteobacteria bacterium]|nr:FAD-binding oxidoreductase [Deltaproteobacteria bacterium]
KIRRLATTRRFAAYTLPGVEAGLEAIRRMMQAGLKPAVVRLYDSLDTLLAGGRNKLVEGESKHLQPPPPPPAPRSRLGTLGTRLGRRLVNLGLHWSRELNTLAALAPAGCHLVLMHEGEEELVAAQAQLCAEYCREQKGKELGPGPAEAWYAHRYSVSFKQSRVYHAGAFVDTMEVAATWERLAPLYRAVRAAIGQHALVLAHFSHAYSEGCSIYFTFVGRAQEAGAEEGYLSLWREALQATAEQGATISHHHGVGELKAEFMLREVGPAGRQVFDALKQTIDPSGGMNPGKLWPHTVKTGGGATAEGRRQGDSA